MKMLPETAASTAPLPNRRAFLRRAGLASAVAAVAPAAATLLMGKPLAQAEDPATDMDVAILNFALNLEYVEAEYYSYAVFGDGMQNHGAGLDGMGKQGETIIKENAKVNFTNPLVAQYAQEIAADEIDHVIFLRAALKGAGATPIAKPTLDLLNSFVTIGTTAGFNNSFDPFADDVNFLLGAYIFEDVGVTAYHGAAGLITDTSYLNAAAGILAVEAYHAAIIRTTLFALNSEASDNTIAMDAEKISQLRDALDGSKDKDQGIVDADGNANIVPTNGAALAFGRTTRQVLNIAYGAVNAKRGGFFPNRFNGAIR